MGISKKKLFHEAGLNCKCELPKVVSFKDAPHYLKFNPFITEGYRGPLDPTQCIRSLFWLTNETVNIWSHLLGWVFFVSITIYDISQVFGSFRDYALTLLVLLAFQACMLLSSLYHCFCCCSPLSYRRWLTMDLFGVSLSLLAIYVSGIYYAFSCEPDGFWLMFYELSVIGIFLFALTMQVLPVKDNEDGFHWRLAVFGGWAAYGIVPTFHWVLIQGLHDSMVQILLPRIIIMYMLSILAFVFYVSRFPERLFPGRMNYFGSSHQIWHVLIFAALYHWHQTGLVFSTFTATHPCPSFS